LSYYFIYITLLWGEVLKVGKYEFMLTTKTQLRYRTTQRGMEMYSVGKGKYNINSL
jgi:hypothetical protein